LAVAAISDTMPSQVGLAMTLGAWLWWAGWLWLASALLDRADGAEAEAVQRPTMRFVPGLPAAAERD
jgi:phosphatidylglycerophosphate synthase